MPMVNGPPEDVLAKAIRVPNAGTPDTSPACGRRKYSLGGNSPVSGSSTPACTLKAESSLKLNRCSTRNCGVQLQRFPEYESAGTASDASEVWARGVKNRLSCPATIDVLAQSRCRVAVRKRRIPKVTPLGAMGNPPAKSNWTSAELLAPATVGPNASRPTSDCRKEPPKLVCGIPGVPNATTCGKSMLSTLPRLVKTLNSAIPDNRTRYFEPLSTLV